MRRLRGLLQLTISGRIMLGALMSLGVVAVVAFGAWYFLQRQDQALDRWIEYERQISAQSETLSMETLSAWREAMQVELRRQQEVTREDLMALMLLLFAGLLPLTIAALMLGFRISSAMRDTASRMTQLSAGEFDIEIPFQNRRDELGEMSRALLHFATAMREVSEARDAMRRLSISDPLTQLLNRRGLDEQMSRLLRGNEPISILTVMHIDLDHFKAINDIFGHDAGDHVLMVVGRRMRQAVRAQDVIARAGGDEFVILLPGLDDLGRLAQIASRLIRNLSQPILHKGNVCQIGASIGIAVGGAYHDGLDPERLLKDADLAVFRSKASGRGRFSVFDKRMRDVVENQRNTANRLRRALDEGQIDAWVQPVMSPDLNRILEVEALARWRDPSQGSIAAEDFIEIALQRKLLPEISAVVLDQSARAMSDWQGTFGGEARISINVSALELKDPQIVDNLRWTLDRCNLDPRYLSLELPADLADERGAERIADVVSKLRSIGIMMTIDGINPFDASLAKLAWTAAKTLKLDPVALERAAADPAAAKDLKQILSQMRESGYRIYAKSLSDARLVQLAKSLGCDGLQGYAVREPKPLEEFKADLASQTAATLKSAV
ncbi:MAG: diguanylate cyclase [Pseudomonadota bacterium]